VVIANCADSCASSVKRYPNYVCIFNQPARLYSIYIANLLLLYRACGVSMQQVLWFLDDLWDAS
jgi:hypothetical protein